MMRFSFSYMILFVLFTACGSPTESNRSESIEADSLQTVPLESQSLQGEIIGDSFSSLSEYYESNEFVKKFLLEEVHTISEDLDDDSILDKVIFLGGKTFITSDDDTVRNGDPGDFNVIIFELSKNNLVDTLFNSQQWVKKKYLDKASFDKPSRGLDNSYFLSYRSGKDHLLFFEEFLYGSGESFRTIVNIYEGEPILIFHDNEEIESVSTNIRGEIEVKTIPYKYKNTNPAVKTYQVKKWMSKIE